MVSGDRNKRVLPGLARDPRSSEPTSSTFLLGTMVLGVFVSTVPTRAMGQGAEAEGERDVSERDVSERDVSERDVSERDASERDVSERDASERDASERDASERDAAVGDDREEIDAMGAGPEASSAGDVESERASESLDPDAARAHEAFQEGSRAVAEMRWGDAERRFREAYALSGVPSALYMQGVALRSLERHVAAAAAFERVVALLGDGSNPDLRAQAARLRSQSRARIATLRLRGLGPAVHRVRIDGQPVFDRRERPLTVPVDSGEHTVVVRREGYETAVWNGSVEPGEEVEVAIALRPRVASAPDPWPRRRRWVIAVAGALAVLAIPLGIGIRSARQAPRVEPTFSDNVFVLPPR